MSQGPGLVPARLGKWLLSTPEKFAFALFPFHGHLSFPSLSHHTLSRSLRSLRNTDFSLASHHSVLAPAIVNQYGITTDPSMLYRYPIRSIFWYLEKHLFFYLLR